MRDVVIKGGKNTLVAFYDPECAHCVEVLPQLDAAAAALADDPDVIVAKMNVVTNSVSLPFEVRGVPTLYFKPSTGFPFRYRGLRDSAALLAFIATKRT